METNIRIQKAVSNDAEDIAVMVGELLSEIMKATTTVPMLCVRPA